MTKIEYVDEVWNPVTGCTWISEGCDNCYARRMARRFNWSFTPRFHWDRLKQPLLWRKPRRILVPSMGDLFHSTFEPRHIGAVWEVMKEAKRHRFFVLTKRPVRAMNFAAARVIGSVDNVFFGVSVENQESLWRIKAMSEKLYFRHYWVSFEPLLGPVDIDSIEVGAVGWIVIGGETGPNARPTRLAWMQEIVDKCAERGIPVFVKQFGTMLARELGLRSRRGNDPIEWPESLRVREFPAKE